MAVLVSQAALQFINGENRNRLEKRLFGVLF